MIRPDLRFYTHTRNHKLAGRDWKDYCLRMLEFNLEEGQTREEKEKLIFIARLFADPRFDQCPAPEAEREKLFATAFGKGGSRATYHRHKRRLQELRGKFDQKAAASIQWVPAHGVQTPFEIKAEQRRACLERERHELQQAGGVVGIADEEEDKQ